MPTILDPIETGGDTRITTPGLSLMVDARLGASPSAVRDSDGTVSALALSTGHVTANGSVSVGAADAAATFRVVAAAQEPPRAEEADGGYNIAISGRSHTGFLHDFAMGNAETYSWLQSYGRRPMYVNPWGNNVILGAVPEFKSGLACRVGIKTGDPQADLDVNGGIRARTLEVTGSLSVKGIEQKPEALDASTLRSLAIDPGTGTLYFV